MKIIKRFVILILLVIIGICASKVLPELKDSTEAKESITSVNQIVKMSKEEDELFSKRAWEKLKEENGDFVGYLVFKSKILSLPVVQSGDNDFYLRKSFDKKYNEQGIPFMDCDCDINSTNITIYGHNVYYDDTAMFSPISFFVDQKKLDGNEVFYFYLENEVRTYQITDVYYLNVGEDNDGYDYLQTHFTDENNFNHWYSYAHSRNLIYINNKITYDDNFITLQTCKRYDSNHRIIVLAKEIDRYFY